MASTSRIERPCTPELHDFDMGTSSTLISIQTPSPPSVNDLSFELSSKLKLDESRDGESKSPSNAVLDIKRTGIAYDARMKRHFHPHTKHFECPERIEAAWSILSKWGVSKKCAFVKCRPASTKELQLVHTEKYIKWVEQMETNLKPAVRRPVDLCEVPKCSPMYHRVDTDTYVMKETNRAARMAAGSTIALAENVVRGHFSNGFALVRPPGHHAGIEKASGFCFFNTAAVTVRSLQAKGLIRRAVILDWDVHHGDGTQKIFYEDDSVLYISLHRWDNGKFFPGTGRPTAVGIGSAKGTNVNIAWNGFGLGDTEYKYTFTQLVMPLIREFAPDFILVSAGFDAADGDPLGGMNVTPRGYSELTKLLCQSGIPLMMVLEGGYNVGVVGECVRACVETMDMNGSSELDDDMSSLKIVGEEDGVLRAAGARAVLSAAKAQRTYWRCLRDRIPALEAQAKKEKDRERAYEKLERLRIRELERISQMEALVVTPAPSLPIFAETTPIQENNDEHGSEAPVTGCATLPLGALQVLNDGAAEAELLRDPEKNALESTSMPILCAIPAESRCTEDSMDATLSSSFSSADETITREWKSSSSDLCENTAISKENEPPSNPLKAVSQPHLKAPELKSRKKVVVKMGRQVLSSPDDQTPPPPPVSSSFTSMFTSTASSPTLSDEMATDDKADSLAVAMSRLVVQQYGKRSPLL